LIVSGLASFFNSTTAFLSPVEIKIDKTKAIPATEATEMGINNFPEKLIEQLKPGGMMVIPVDEGDKQRMMRITKTPGGDIETERFTIFSFVPMLEGRN
jgi:hypothetical protein